MKVGEIIKIQSTTAVSYFEYGRDLMNTNCGRWFKEQKIDNKVKGKFSRQSKKRFSELIKNWISVIAANIEVNSNGKHLYSDYLKFVTLTLSSDQIHDDIYIRRYMLNDFIRTIKNKYKVKSYLYCSEAQKNGNIHFHIVIDQRINHEVVRSIWNRIQAAHGYIDEFEKKHGHRNPNSTDIHSFRKIKSVSAYLIKYFTKDELRRKLTGRLWGSSENLKLLQPFKTEINYEFSEFLNQYCEKENPYLYKSDFFTFFRQINFAKVKNTNKKIYNQILQFYLNQNHIL